MKKNVKLVILLEVILLVAAVGLLAMVTGVGVNFPLSNLWDPVSFLFILFITLPGLIIMGEWKNFLKAFSVGQKPYSLLELKDINGAVASCQKLVLYGGLAGIVVQLIILLAEISDVKILSVNIAVVFILLLYTAVLEYLLVPLKLNAEKIMNKEMDLDDEE